MRPALLTALALLSLAPAPALASAAMVLPPHLADRTAADFARDVAVHDGGTGRLVLSTRQVRGAEGPSRGAWTEDAHLTVTIDRATGLARWQVRHELIDPRLRAPVTAAVELPGSPVTPGPVTPGPVTPGPVTPGPLPAGSVQMDHWFDRCPAGEIGLCRDMTRIVVELPEEQVRSVAAAWRPGSAEALVLRFTDGRGKTVTTGMALAEFAGLLASYDEWRRQQSL